jgi:regulator of protease activity HflC (stomatin/prohibitin superfamily)
MDETKFKNFIFTLLIIFVIIVIIGLFYLGEKLQTSLLWVFAIFVFIYLIFKFRIILTLKDYERAVIFRFGKVKRVGGPGWTFVWPLIEKPNLVTLRVETIDIPPQNVLTNDNIQLRIDGVLFISVKNEKESIVNSIVKVEDYRKASTMYVIAVLRDIVGEFSLTEVITQIEEINTRLKKALENVSKEWGVKVTSVEITDIKIPDDILAAMHEQKAAVQKKLAIYELAESEKAKILAVRDATENLDEKTVVYYYIKALEKMAEGQSTKIIFPMELTNLLEKVSTTLIKNKDVHAVEKKVNEDTLKQYLPFIKGYLKEADEKPKRRKK